MATTQVQLESRPALQSLAMLPALKMLLASLRDVRATKQKDESPALQLSTHNGRLDTRIGMCFWEGCLTTPSC